VSSPNYHGASVAIWWSRVLRRCSSRFQIALDDQKREWLSKSDFDRYSSKAVNHNDLARLVNRKDFLTVEERLTTRGSDITNLEGKLSDLAVVTQDRHREGQGTQQQNMTRFEGHGTSILNAQKQQSQLKTTLDAQKADFDVRWNVTFNMLLISLMDDTQPYRAEVRDRSVHS